MVHLSLFILPLLMTLIGCLSVQPIKSPVVLIPGFGGCQAFATEDNNQNSELIPVWLSLMKVILPSKLLKYFRLVFDPVTNKTSDVPGVTMHFPGFGGTSTVDYLDSTEHIFGTYFGELTKALRKDPSFVPGITIRGAPFDFRKSSVEFINRQSLQWKKKYIRGYIAAAAPMGGTVKGLKAVLSGDNINIFFERPIYFRELLRSMVASLLLLPNPQIYSKEDILVTTPDRNYTARDYKQLFSDSGYDLGYQMFEHSYKSIDPLTPPEGIDELYCVHGVKVATPDHLTYTGDKTSPETFSDDKLEIHYGDGDGTVHLRSLSVCKSWPNVQIIELPGVSHLRMLWDQTFIAKVGDILGAYLNRLSVE